MTHTSRVGIELDAAIDKAQQAADAAGAIIVCAIGKHDPSMGAHKVAVKVRMCVPNKYTDPNHFVAVLDGLEAQIKAARQRFAEIADEAVLQ